ncbi:hypothetical protein [Salinibaculum rarum]|uniref:hypothetical protein n=1 Tax=Salinibaculum rarum TaxID=3058903 RepID=UPI00265D6593|nr:hypothetical protein [Salinibaculum sp. KK48]
MAVGKQCAPTHAIGMVEARCRDHPSPKHPLATVQASRHFHAATVFTGPTDVGHLDALLHDQRRITPDECHACGRPVTTETRVADWPPDTITTGAIRDFLGEFNGEVALEITPTPPIDGGMVVTEDTTDAFAPPLDTPTSFVIGVFGDNIVVTQPGEVAGFEYTAAETLEDAAVLVSVRGAHAVEPVPTSDTNLDSALRAYKKRSL